MTWYNQNGNQSDIVLSTRIRFARNLAGYAFGNRLGEDKATEIIEKVGGLLSENGFQKIDFSQISPLEAMSLVEKHYASRELADKKSPRALMLNEPCGYAVMLCEEDHLRMQCILPGLALEDAYASLCKLDDLVDGHFEIAYDQTLGYLTHCPTNLGTGMRASVMMFLPALTMAGRIGTLASQLSKIGLTMRGLYGEGTAAEGSLYQISNQITLGLTEENTLAKLSDVIKQICENEKKLRDLITEEKNPALIDRICRAEGTLRHAFMMSSKELISLYADVRLGVCLGVIKNISTEELDALFIETLPATLMLNADGAKKDQRSRDLLRASRIKEQLNR